MRLIYLNLIVSAMMGGMPLAHSADDVGTVADPAAVVPKPGSLSSPVPIRLKWPDLGTGSTYILEFSNEPKFLKPTSSEVAGKTEYLAQLPSEGIYYFRVAKKGDAPVAWSRVTKTTVKQGSPERTLVLKWLPQKSARVGRFRTKFSLGADRFSYSEPQLGTMSLISLVPAAALHYQLSEAVRLTAGGFYQGLNIQKSFNDSTLNYWAADIGAEYQFRDVMPGWSSSIYLGYRYSSMAVAPSQFGFTGMSQIRLGLEVSHPIASKPGSAEISLLGIFGTVQDGIGPLPFSLNREFSVAAEYRFAHVPTASWPIFIRAEFSQLSAAPSDAIQAARLERMGLKVGSHFDFK